MRSAARINSPAGSSSRHSPERPPLFDEQDDLLDRDPALQALDHVVDGQRGDRGGGHRLHLDPGLADRARLGEQLDQARPRRRRWRRRRRRRAAAGGRAGSASRSASRPGPRRSGRPRAPRPSARPRRSTARGGRRATSAAAPAPSPAARSSASRRRRPSAPGRRRRRGVSSLMSRAARTVRPQVAAARPRPSSPSPARVQLPLPDRRLGLDPVDRLARAGERFLAVPGGDGDDDRRLAQRHPADPVLGGGGEQAVALDAVGEDRRDPLLGHLPVGLVVEARDLPGHALEGDDRRPRRDPRRPGAARAPRRGERLVLTRAWSMGAGAPPEIGGISASSSPARDSSSPSPAYSRLTAIRSGIRSTSSSRPGAAARRSKASRDGGALGQLDLDRVAPGALAEDREEADRDGHPPMLARSSSSTSTMSPAASAASRSGSAPGSRRRASR